MGVPMVNIGLPVYNQTLSTIKTDDQSSSTGTMTPRTNYNHSSSYGQISHNHGTATGAGNSGNAIKGSPPPPIVTVLNIPAGPSCYTHNTDTSSRGPGSVGTLTPVSPRLPAAGDGLLTSSGAATNTIDSLAGSTTTIAPNELTPRVDSRVVPVEKEENTIETVERNTGGRKVLPLASSLRHGATSSSTRELCPIPPLQVVTPLQIVQPLLPNRTNLRKEKFETEPAASGSSSRRCSREIIAAVPPTEFTQQATVTNIFDQDKQNMDRSLYPHLVPNSVTMFNSNEVDLNIFGIGISIKGSLSSPVPHSTGPKMYPNYVPRKSRQSGVLEESDSKQCTNSDTVAIPYESIPIPVERVQSKDTEIQSSVSQQGTRVPSNENYSHENYGVETERGASMDIESKSTIDYFHTQNSGRSSVANLTIGTNPSLSRVSSGNTGNVVLSRVSSGNSRKQVDDEVVAEIVTSIREAAKLDSPHSEDYRLPSMIMLQPAPAVPSYLSKAMPKRIAEPSMKWTIPNDNNQKDISFTRSKGNTGEKINPSYSANPLAVSKIKVVPPKEGQSRDSGGSARSGSKDLPALPKPRNYAGTNLKSPRTTTPPRSPLSVNSSLGTPVIAGVSGLKGHYSNVHANSVTSQNSLTRTNSRESVRLTSRESPPRRGSSGRPNSKDKHSSPLLQDRILSFKDRNLSNSRNLPVGNTGLNSNIVMSPTSTSTFSEDQSSAVTNSPLMKKMGSKESLQALDKIKRGKEDISSACKSKISNCNQSQASSPDSLPLSAPIQVTDVEHFNLSAPTEHIVLGSPPILSSPAPSSILDSPRTGELRSLSQERYNRALNRSSNNGENAGSSSNVDESQHLAQQLQNHQEMLRSRSASPILVSRPNSSSPKLSQFRALSRQEGQINTNLLSPPIATRSPLSQCRSSPRIPPYTGATSSKIYPVNKLDSDRSNPDRRICTSKGSITCEISSERRDSAVSTHANSEVQNCSDLNYSIAHATATISQRSSPGTGPSSPPEGMSECPHSQRSSPGIGPSIFNFPSDQSDEINNLPEGITNTSPSPTKFNSAEDSEVIEQYNRDLPEVDPEFELIINVNGSEAAGGAVPGSSFNNQRDEAAAQRNTVTGVTPSRRKLWRETQSAYMINSTSSSSRHAVIQNQQFQGDDAAGVNFNSTNPAIIVTDMGNGNRTADPVGAPKTPSSVNNSSHTPPLPPGSPRPGIHIGLQNRPVSLNSSILSSRSLGLGNGFSPANAENVARGTEGNYSRPNSRSSSNNNLLVQDQIHLVPVADRSSRSPPRSSGNGSNRNSDAERDSDENRLSNVDPVPPFAAAARNFSSEASLNRQAQEILTKIERCSEKVDKVLNSQTVLTNQEVNAVATGHTGEESFLTESNDSLGLPAANITGHPEARLLGKRKSRAVGTVVTTDISKNHQQDSERREYDNLVLEPLPIPSNRVDSSMDRANSSNIFASEAGLDSLENSLQNASKVVQNSQDRASATLQNLKSNFPKTPAPTSYQSGARTDAASITAYTGGNGDSHSVSPGGYSSEHSPLGSNIEYTSENQGSFHSHSTLSSESPNNNGAVEGENRFSKSNKKQGPARVGRLREMMYRQETKSAGTNTSHSDVEILESDMQREDMQFGENNGIYNGSMTYRNGTRNGSGGSARNRGRQEYQEIQNQENNDGRADNGNRTINLDNYTNHEKADNSRSPGPLRFFVNLNNVQQNRMRGWTMDRSMSYFVKDEPMQIGCTGSSSSSSTKVANKKESIQSESHHIEQEVTSPTENPNHDSSPSLNPQDSSPSLSPASSSFRRSHARSRSYGDTPSVNFHSSVELGDNGTGTNNGSNTGNSSPGHKRSNSYHNGSGGITTRCRRSGSNGRTRTSSSFSAGSAHFRPTNGVENIDVIDNPCGYTSFHDVEHNGLPGVSGKSIDGDGVVVRKISLGGMGLALTDELAASETANSELTTLKTVMKELQVLIAAEKQVQFLENGSDAAAGIDTSPRDKASTSPFLRLYDITFPTTTAIRQCYNSRRLSPTPNSCHHNVNRCISPISDIYSPIPSSLANSEENNFRNYSESRPGSSLSFSSTHTAATGFSMSHAAERSTMSPEADRSPEPEMQQVVRSRSTNTSPENVITSPDSGVFSPPPMSEPTSPADLMKVLRPVRPDLIGVQQNMAAQQNQNLDRFNKNQIYTFNDYSPQPPNDVEPEDVVRLNNEFNNQVGSSSNHGATASMQNQSYNGIPRPASDSNLSGMDRNSLNMERLITPLTPLGSLTASLGGTLNSAINGNLNLSFPPSGEGSMGLTSVASGNSNIIGNTASGSGMLSYSNSATSLNTLGTGPSPVPIIRTRSAGSPPPMVATQQITGSNRLLSRPTALKIDGPGSSSNGNNRVRNLNSSSHAENFDTNANQQLQYEHQCNIEGNEIWLVQQRSHDFSLKDILDMSVKQETKSGEFLKSLQLQENQKSNLEKPSNTITVDDIIGTVNVEFPLNDSVVIGRINRLNKIMLQQSLIQDVFTAVGIKKVMYSLLLGLRFLHEELEIPHGSVRPENVIIDTNGEFSLTPGVDSVFVPQKNSNSVKKSDSLAEKEKSETSGKDHKNLYIAPELLTGNPNEELESPDNDSMSGDIWSLGLIFYELLFIFSQVLQLELPIPSGDEEEIQKNLMLHVTNTPEIISVTNVIPSLIQELVLEDIRFTDDAFPDPLSYSSPVTLYHIPLFDREKRLAVSRPVCTQNFPFAVPTAILHKTYGIQGLNPVSVVSATQHGEVFNKCSNMSTLQLQEIPKKCTVLESTMYMLAMRAVEKYGNNDTAPFVNGAGTGSSSSSSTVINTITDPVNRFSSDSNSDSHPISNNFVAFSMDLLLQMLDKRPEKRPNVNQILNHSFFKEIHRPGKEWKGRQKIVNNDSQSLQKKGRSRSKEVMETYIQNNKKTLAKFAKTQDPNYTDFNDIRTVNSGSNVYRSSSRYSSRNKSKDSNTIPYTVLENEENNIELMNSESNIMQSNTEVGASTATGNGDVNYHNVQGGITSNQEQLLSAKYKIFDLIKDYHKLIGKTGNYDM